MQLEMSRFMIIQTPKCGILFGDSSLLTHLITSGHTPLGGIIGLFHSVDEITICLPYHKKFVFLGHTFVYMEYYREFYEACTTVQRHSRVPIPLGADPENHSLGRYTSSWFILDVSG